MVNNETIIDEMILALEANIKYLQKEGSSTIRLTNGQLISTIGDLFVYEFLMDFLQELEIESEIEVRLKSDSTQGKVISINENIIQVQVEKNIGKTVPEALLVVSSYYLLQLLHDKLQKIKSGEIKITELAHKTFNPQDSRSEVNEDYIIPSVGTSLNEYQENALRLVMGSEVSYIWGPPGTGKTQLIAKILEGLLSQNISTLLLSHTNKATDEALNKAVHYLLATKQLSDLESGNIIRVGKINDDSQLKVEDSSKQKAVDYVDPSRALEIKGNPIRNEVRNLSTEIEKIKEEYKDCEKIIELFNSLDDCQKSLEKTNTELMSYKDKLGAVNISITDNKKSLSDINKRIDKYQTTNSFIRLFSGTNLSKLTIEKASLLEKIERLKQKVIEVSYQIEVVESRLRILLTDEKTLIKEIGHSSREENEAKLEPQRKKIKDLEAQKSELETKLSNLVSLVIKDAKIIATTLTKSYSSAEILSREYDCVIIDEASMAPLPAVWHACGLSKTKTVLVGDFLQLPPIAKHKILEDRNLTEDQKRIEQELVDKWLKRDIFRESEIEDQLRSGVDIKCLRQLRIQYRMHPEISNLINYLVYSNIGKNFELISDTSTNNKGEKLLSKEPLPSAHVGIFDTSEMGTIAIQTDSGSYYNLYHALLSVEIAKQAIKSGYRTIGIISPFRAQINLIHKILKDEKIFDKVDADTVHKFQGGEKQIIIFDTTTANQTKLTDDNEVGGDDEKLINVAFSRAQEKCVVIADTKNLLVKHSMSSELRRFVEYARLNNYPFINTREILPKYIVTEKTEQWLAKIKNAKELGKETSNSELFDETDFYNAFVNDLLKAKHEVIIDSPYITVNRVNFFLPIFEHLINKGVNIFLLTRVTKEHDALMRQQAESGINELGKLGVFVLPFVGYMHRKLAMIDRNILWEGSLNILSQKDSHEIMRRFSGESTCKQMFTFLKLDKNIGKMGENKLRACEFCKETGGYYWTDKSRFGNYWTFCLLRMHKPGVAPKTDAEVKARKEDLTKLRKMIKKYTARGEPICSNPEHDPCPMVKRKSRFGGYLWGCKFYPRCRVTEKYIEK